MAKKPPKPPAPAGRATGPRKKTKAKKVQRRPHLPLSPRREKALLEYLNNSDHRTAAILGAGLVENDLALLVASRLRRLTVSQHKALFRGEKALLGTFHAKIEFAYALGLYGVAIKDELHRVRRIRNHFAHELSVRTFASPAVRSDVDDLEGAHYAFWFVSDGAYRDWPDNRIFRFARSCLQLSARLIDQTEHPPRRMPLRGNYGKHDRARESFHRIFVKRRALLIQRPRYDPAVPPRQILASLL